VYFDVDAELRLSVRSPAHAAEPMGAVRSLVGSRIDQLFGAGAVQQHAGIRECLFHHRIKERSPAILLRDGRECLCRDPIDIHRASGPIRIWADGQRFRSAHLIDPVAEGAPGAVSFTSSGRVLPGNEVQIASDSGELLAQGQVGEILVRSDSLFTGYYHRPDLTAKALVDDWYHSGDLGFCLEGELYVVGRKKDLLIVGGENLYPQDIEEIVASHSAIHDGRVVAMGVYNPDLGTEDIVVVAEVERQELLADAMEIEREIRNLIVEGIGVAVRMIFLKPPKWIVKSTAGKAARSTTREKLMKEHPELNVES